MTLDSLPIVWLPSNSAAVTKFHCEPCGRGFYNNLADFLLSYRPKMPRREDGHTVVRHTKTVWWVPVCECCLEPTTARAYDLGAIDITIHVPAVERSVAA